MKSTMNYFPHGISDQDLGSRCIASICRVPLGMRRAGEERARHAYDPELVSIGPFHHGNPALKLMEEHKSHVISRGLERINRTRRLESNVNQEGVITMDSLAQAIEGSEQRARACYSEAFDIHSEKFRHMMVLDGLFIIEVFDRFLESNGGISWDEAETDPIFRSRCQLPMLMLDLIKLENQLPFFILEKLFDLTHTGNKSFSHTFTYLALYFYASFNPSMPKSCLTYHDSRGIMHLLELFHSVYKPIVNRSPRLDTRRSIGSIRDIRLADITFTRVQRNLLDIIYSRTGQAVLEIPQLLIDYSNGGLRGSHRRHRHGQADAEPIGLTEEEKVEDEDNDGGLKSGHMKTKTTAVAGSSIDRFIPDQSRRLEANMKQEGVITMDSLAQAIEELEPRARACSRARACYSEAFDIHSEKFRHMMVLDGLFIFEVFDRFLESNGGISWDEAETDPIFRSRWIPPMLMLDLIKLENQLPFFILEKLFDLTHTGNKSFSHTFTYLALYFYASFNPSMPKSCLTYHDSRGIVHLLELFHSVTSLL
ncbi:hypothetical protein RJ640_015238 [Escallonia rubra]|uniref:Uncharacterized protein n=1 Tax=Escallonia rubra TaxID=112253 RepID=A0AA88QS55_9ASTE|nr:hypothetical protein RJ640_015238 [Escallonia rubra]